MPRLGEAARNLYLETQDGILDLLTEVLGVGDFERLRARATRIELFGLSLAVISLEDLIAAKEAVGRGGRKGSACCVLRQSFPSGEWRGVRSAQHAIG